jgi:hypothetical protein
LRGRRVRNPFSRHGGGLTRAGGGRVVQGEHRLMSGAIGDRQRNAAKVAGFLYLLSFVTVVSVTYGIVRPLVAGADPAQAARNILAHETLFRVGIVGNLLYCVEIVALSAALYVVLEPVDPLLALLAALGRLIQGFTWLLICINLFTALRLLTQPDYVRALPPDQLPVLARLHLSGFDPYYVGLLFWCLGSTQRALPPVAGSRIVAARGLPIRYIM